MKEKKRIVDFHVTFVFVESVGGSRMMRIYKAYHRGLEIFEKDLRLGQTFRLDIKKGGTKGKKDDIITFCVKVNNSKTENGRTLLTCRAQNLSGSDYLLVTQNDGEGRRHKQMEDVLETELDDRYEVEWEKCSQKSENNVADNWFKGVLGEVCEIFRD